jgi:hypothetical protein
MKQLTYILIMLFSIVTFSQEKKKTIKSKDTDKAVNIILDSLSKVYKKEVVSYSVVERNGRKKISITYYDKNKKLRSQVISDTAVE